MQGHGNLRNSLDPELGLGERANPSTMNRLPIYEVIRDTNLSTSGSSVFRPVTGDECTVVIYDVQLSENYRCNFSMWFTRDAEFDAVLEEDTCPVSLVLGTADCTIDRGLEMLVSSMRVGDIREFCLGDGHGGTIVGRIRLTAVKKFSGVRGWYADDETKLEEAMAQKEIGNLLYRQQRYLDAFHRFNLSIRSVLFLRDEQVDEVREKRDALYSALCNNMAACQLKMRNYDYARVLATKALTIDPDNLKALVRRSEAFVGLRMFDDALADARHVLDICPAHVFAKGFLEEAVHGIQDQQADYKIMVKRMFHR